MVLLYTFPFSVIHFFSSLKKRFPLAKLSGKMWYITISLVNDPVDVTEVEMERIAEDGLFEYYEAKIRDSYTRVCYYFSLDDGNNRIYYGEYGFSGEIPTNRTHFFQFPSNWAPQWLKTPSNIRRIPFL